MKSSIGLLHTGSYTHELEKLLLSQCKTKFYAAGSAILEPNQPIHFVYYVLEGITVHTTISIYGQERVLYRLGHGWFFSEATQIYDETLLSPRYSTAETDVVVICIPKNTFQHLLSIPLFSVAIIDSLHIKCSLLRQDIENSTFFSNKLRLLALLVSMCDKKEIIDNEWFSMKNKMKQQDYAAILGINRVTVSRVLTELKNDKLLRSVNGQIQINKNYQTALQDFKLD